jgi:type II secretory pathway pseudopilin PulG
MRSLKNTGFTIVETLMFLAVSGVIFVSAVALISGQLSNSQSKDAMNQLESTVRGTLNDVSNGYYPEFNTNYSCNGVANGSTRGTNQDCMFAGKSITFGPTQTSVCGNKNAVMLIDTYVVPQSTTVVTSASDLTLICGLEVAENYPGSIQPLSDYQGKEFYILNTNYSYSNSSTFSSSGGSNSVVLEKSDGGRLTVLNGGTGDSDSSYDNIVCFQDGNENSSLEFGIGGILTVSIKNYKDQGCSS